MRPLSRREYILDVATETERMATSYTFWCRRVVWGQPLKFDNELYVTVHYNQVWPHRGAPLAVPTSPRWSRCVLYPPPHLFQVLPDYLKGLFTVLPPSRLGEQHFQQLAKLAALQHRAKDAHRLPTTYGHGREPPSRGDWEPPEPELASSSVSPQEGGAGLCPPAALPAADGAVLAPRGDPARAASPGAQRTPSQGAVPG